MTDDAMYGVNYPILPKALAALETISNEKNGHEPQTLDEVIKNLPYEVTKPAFQFTVRALMRRGLIEKLNRKNIGGRSKRLLRITPLGLHKIQSEKESAKQAADKRTCEISETEVTDRLLEKIKEIFGE